MKDMIVSKNPTDQLYVGPLKDAVWLKPVKAFFDAAREAEIRRTGESSMLPRDKTYFSQLLAGETGTLVVAIEGGEIKAMGALMLPGTLSDAVEKKYVTAPHPCESLDLPSDAKVGVVSTFCSLCADVQKEITEAAAPLTANSSKRKFSQLVLNEILVQAKEHRLNHLVAQVKHDNIKSWMRFMKSGFGLYAAFTPDDGLPRFLLSYPAERMFGGASNDDLSELHERTDLLSAKTFLPVLNCGQKIRLAGPSSRPGRIKFVFG